MPVYVTETYKGRRYGLQDSAHAEREFLVIGAADEVAAVTAVDSGTGLTIPQRNDSFSARYPSKLKCVGPEISEVLGPLCWRVRAPYEVPPDGSFQEQHDDPTDEEAEITWESFEIGEMVDIDLDGKPIVNVLGDPIGPCSRDITCKRLSIAWNDSSYNLPLYSAYENTVCTAATALPSPNGTVTIAAHHLSCRTIQPAGPFKASAEFVRMRATFEIIPYLALGKYPFQHRVFNRGDNAFFLDSTSTRGLGRIVDAKNNPATGVALKANGLPYDDGPGYKVSSPAKDKDTIVGISPVKPSLEDEDTTYAIVRYFRKTKGVPTYAPLGLF